MKKKIKDKKEDKEMFKFLLDILNARGLSNIDIDSLWVNYLGNKRVGLEKEFLSKKFKEWQVEDKSWLGKISIEDISPKQKINKEEEKNLEQELESKRRELKELEDKIELLKSFINIVFKGSYTPESFWSKFKI